MVELPSGTICSCEQKIVALVRVAQKKKRQVLTRRDYSLRLFVLTKSQLPQWGSQADEILSLHKTLVSLFEGDVSFSWQRELLMFNTTSADLILTKELLEEVNNPEE